MTFKELYSEFIAQTPIKRKIWHGYWKYDPRNDNVKIFTKEGNQLSFSDVSVAWSFTLANILADDWEVATNKNCSVKVI